MTHQHTEAKIISPKKEEPSQNLKTHVTPLDVLRNPGVLQSPC